MQQPIYFLSHALAEAEQRYPLVEKAAFAVIIAARKLRPYFDAHPVVVRTDQPLEKALERMESSGRLVKWAIELSEYGVKFQPRSAIKAQALADFLVECTCAKEGKEPDTKRVWELHTDGSSAANGAGAGLVIVSPDGTMFEYALKFLFKASNNKAEYEAAIAGIETCLAAGAKHVILRTDSQLVAKQIQGEYETRGETMAKYLAKAKELISRLRTFEVNTIPRSQNQQADALSRLASSSLSDLNRSVFIEVRERRHIEEVTENIFDITQEESWMDPIMAYKLKNELPLDPPEARKVKVRST